ncbi:hypothetical protein [Roseomonas fluvialis]|uniref:Uncharacterized protein n=1 Tax=Roseomonas fluvialis TaxID=1750527 RepID=A0ABM9SEJ8_9PROT|nr:hypothetical protein [Roseomonas fluvialis]BDG73561.1 hypothetical protein Rmf_34900 [Roseomonas fluvialis]
MNRAFLTAVLSLLCLAPLGVRAEASPPPIAPGTPYAAAREALLRDGWQPLRDPEADACGATERRCTGRPEMVACAGTGEAPCIFAWQRGGVAIEVITRGEETTVAALRTRR